MKTLIDDATTLYALKHMLPKLVAWIIGLTLCLGLCLTIALLTEGTLSNFFHSLVGASTALLYTYIHRLRRVCAELHRLE
jgi:hypothetical protein